MNENEVELAWARLSAAIDEAIGLLGSVGESFWASRLAEGKAKVETFGANGLDSVLAWFGGMGSFNDLILQQVNGHSMSEPQLREANERLWDLRDEIYAPAVDLRRAFPS